MLSCQSGSRTCLNNMFGEGIKPGINAKNSVPTIHNKVTGVACFIVLKNDNEQ